jgi:nitronate monooxygenase
MITTTFSTSLGLRHPLVQAPMAGPAGGTLAGAVSAAGGLGMLGVGSTTPLEWIAEQAGLARARGPFGIGLLRWALNHRPELLDAVIAERPLAIALSFGDLAPYVERVHAAGIRLFCQVQDAATAERAIVAGADVLVAQGTEAGGHTGSVGTMPLLQLVLETAKETAIPVLAAGGIATGPGIAGALAMGAAGVWLGTRFVATVEALGAEAAKNAILRATETETVHTRVFDIVQQLPWPRPFPGRALANAFTMRWADREEQLLAHLDEVRATFEEARSRGDYKELFVYAGQAVGLIHDLPSASALIERLMTDAEATLRRVPEVLADERTDVGGTL